MKGDDIKKLREVLRWTQEQLAAELGVSWASISRWENDKVKPSPTALKDLENLTEKAGVKLSDDELILRIVVELKKCHLQRDPDFKNLAKKLVTIVRGSM